MTASSMYRGNFTYYRYLILHDSVPFLFRTVRKKLYTYKSKKNIDTKQSNKRNNQNWKSKRQDYHMK